MTVAAIVPAYNESPRIKRVLDVLASYHGFTEAIVVDNGSSDDTAQIARLAGARVIHEPLKGKGYALDAGVRASNASILFFCDADISGLTHDIITETLQPVREGKSEMCIVARKRKIRHLGFGLTYSPLLDGQRALTRDFWASVPRRFRRGYEVEAALNHAARSRKSLSVLYRDITQVTKEEKEGVFRGTISRYAMYRDIALARIRMTLGL